MLEYEYLTPDEWEQSAPAKKAKPSPWDPILAELEQEKIVKLPLEDARERRGYRIAIARRARVRGYKVEFREVAGGLALKKGKMLGAAEAEKRSTTRAVKSETPPAKKRGRPRKDTLAAKAR